MSRASAVAPAHYGAVLALLLAGALLLMPPMLTAGADPLGGVVAILAVGLVALVGLGALGVSLRTRLVRSEPGSDDAPTLVRSGRVTDPTHHPVRPRAPGIA